MYTIADYTTDKTITVEDKYELEDKLNAMFDRDAFAYEDRETGEDHTIGEVIDQLVEAINRGEYAGDYTAALNIGIE